MLDLRNNPVSYDNAQALEEFEVALREFQTFFGDPIERVETILANHPGFLVAHLFRAVAYYLTSERRYLEPARQSLADAQALGHGANERERGLLAAVDRLVSGRWAEASVAFDEILQNHPTDALALQAGHLMDFLRGDALNLRNRPGRVLSQWDHGMPGYSYMMGMYAFGLEESNQYDQAEQVGRRALEIEQRDPWSVHAVVHVLEMLGRANEGIEFLESRENDWAPDNGFAYHNWWHLALMYMEREDDARVLRLIDDCIFADADDAMMLLDVTAVLWRLLLVGVDVSDRMERLARIWESKVRNEVGYYAFNDLHAAIAFAATGRDEVLTMVEQRLVEGLEANAKTDAPHNLEMTSRAGLPLIRAIIAYRHGRYAQASDLIRGARDSAHVFGGSHAQRDLLNLTLLSAAQKGGDSALVQHLLNERAMFKPDGVLGRRVVAAA